MLKNKNISLHKESDYLLYLKSSEITDAHHPSIIDMAKELTSKSTGLSQKIENILNFIKDSIVYHFTPWETSASKTLEMRHGMCSNRMNLAVALCRAVTIPSRLHIVHVKKEWLKDVVMQSYFPLVRETTRHCQVQILVNNTWEVYDVDDPIPEPLKVPQNVEIYTSMEDCLVAREKGIRGLGSNTIFRELNKRWRDRKTAGEKPDILFPSKRILGLVGRRIPEKYAISAMLEIMMIDNIKIIHVERSNLSEVRSRIDKIPQKDAPLIVLDIEEDQMPTEICFNQQWVIHTSTEGKVVITGSNDSCCFDSDVEIFLPGLLEKLRNEW